MVIRDGHYLENKVVDWSSAVEIVQQIVYSFGLCLLLLPTLPGIHSGRHSPVDIMALYAISMKLRKNSSALAECVRRSQGAVEGDKRRQDLASESLPSLICQRLLNFQPVRDTSNLLTSDSRMARCKS